MTENEKNVQEKKPNPFVKFWKDWWLGFVDSFRYNPCKLAGILVALPGLFIGFFLGYHSKIIFLVEEGGIDLSGFYMFVLVLLGCINIFNGVTLSSKRNLGTVIMSSIFTLAITVFGVLWIVGIIQSYILAHSKFTMVGGYNLNINHYMSIICVALSIICSVAGCILGFIKRNKNYKKVVMF